MTCVEGPEFYKLMEGLVNENTPDEKVKNMKLFRKYMKHVRKGPGVISFGNLKGEEYYQACLERSTSIKNINATELYQFGMQVTNAKSQII